MQPYSYTKDIQGMNKGVYKKFFSQYDLVISLPHLIRLGHGIGKGASFLTGRKKIPHQLFLGINIVDHKKCRFCTIENFDIYTQTFTSGSAVYEFVRSIDSIEAACTKIMKQADISYGLDIGILTEYPKGYGTSFNSVMFTLLAVALFVQEKKVSLEVLKNYSFQHTNLFADISFLASYMKYLAIGSAGSCLPFVALQPQTVPTFQIGTIDFSKVSEQELAQRIWNLSRLFECQRGEVGNKKMGWYPLHPSEKQPNGLAIDIALLHVGTSYESLREKEQLLGRMNTQQRASWFHEITKENGLAVSMDNILLSPNEIYGHMSTLYNTRLFHACIAALQGENESINDILSVLKDMGFYHCLVEHQYDILTRLHALFVAQKSFPQESCAFLPMTTVKTGGTFLAIIPRHGERETLMKMVEHASLTNEVGIKLIYASRKEETKEFGGVTLHQYISENIFSEYISAGTVQLLLGDGTSHMGEYDAILAHPALSSGITFDMIKRKVLVEGQKVNHKVICSQSATIEIMLYLCEHIGEFIPNRLLPASAYSKHKNEMISKILLPLQEILMKYCDEKLDVICTGTLYERTICLKQKPQRIHLIHHVHP